MQLEEIDDRSVEVAQTALHERREVLAVVARRGVWLQAASRFRRHHDLLAPVTTYLCDQPFRTPVAVDVRRVDEIDTEVDCAVKCTY